MSRHRLIVGRDEYDEIFAVGDVHGHLDLLLGAEERMRENSKPGGRKLIIMLGDYIDRGPHSYGVIEHLIAAPPAGFDRICLTGNHEAIMLAFLAGIEGNGAWLDWGGKETVASYGVDPYKYLDIDGTGHTLRTVLNDVLPQSHLDFMGSLPICVSSAPYLFTHAGVVPGKPLADQADEDLFWIREPFLTLGPQLPGLTVVHGHTPSLEPTFAEGRIGIDTGAYKTGRLTVLKIAGETAEII
jgi:serine/threonine protein phosphatase 1